MAVLRGGGHMATKINITFFVGMDVLNIFFSNNFFEKNNIFRNISEKLFLGGVTIFEGTEGRKTRMIIIFFFGKWGTKYSF